MSACVGIALFCAASVAVVAPLALVAFAMGQLARLSPHARWLGRHVLVKKYEASEWEAATVVCVSHHGSLCIRRDGETRGWWMDSKRVAGRVRFADEGRWLSWE